MALEVARTEEQEADADRVDARAILKEVAIAVAIVGALFGALFAYTQTYPPLVVVESSSMQHSDDASYLGVIDTGDLVLVQAVRARSDVITWIEGWNRHSTYGDFGDVIVFHKPGAAPGTTPVIHRAILYVRYNRTVNGVHSYDVPDLESFPVYRWDGVPLAGTFAGRPTDLVEVTIRGMGWQGDLVVTFNLTALGGMNPLFSRAGFSGFITMGDNNAYHACFAGRDPCGPGIPYDSGWIVPVGNILGRARGEIPWLGLLKLTFQPTLLRVAGAVFGILVGVMLPRTNRNAILVLTAVAGAMAGYVIAGAIEGPPPDPGACCRFWGDPDAPKNSWDSLLIVLPLIVGAPLIYEGVAWAWNRFAAPWFRRRLGRPEEGAPMTDPNEPR